MAEFLLVHGAWHGGWCFERLADELGARGHTVEAPDLPSDEVGLDQRDYARLLGPRPEAIAVGHSLGAQTVAQLHVKRRVYLGGVLPIEQVYAECFVDGFGGAVRDELGRSYWPDIDTAATRLYPDCPRDVVEAAFPRLRPQAPIDALSVPLAGSVVIATLRDAAIDGAWQVRTGRAHGADVLELDAGHFPMLTHAAALADVLVSLT